MIIEIDENTLHQVKNPDLRVYAGLYVDIYRNFKEQVSCLGIEFEADDHHESSNGRLAALKAKGARVRNDNRSVVINQLSPACQACQTGVDSATFFISLQCHRDCYYCFNPNQEDYLYYRANQRDPVAELQALQATGAKMRHLSLTGGEPLLHKGETILFFQQARQRFPGVYTRLYTCGDHLERETLQGLKDARLDEIRFSIRMHDLAKGQQHTYRQIALAREFIPNVLVELPVLPNTFNEMKSVLLELEQLGVFGINLLEFLFPFNNAETYREHGYKIKARPYRVLYNYWYAGGLPIAGSETVCLDLIDFALDARLGLGVHYCSGENKHSGQIYQQNSGKKLAAHQYFSQKDYFLKSAKVFGQDCETVKRIFDQAGYQGYHQDEKYNFLEFHVNKIRLLKKIELEIGISTAVFEPRGVEEVLRELRLDITTPQSFKLSDV